MPRLFQIEVNPETSKLVQLALFNKGYVWETSNKTIKHTEHKFLCIWDDYTICFTNTFNHEVLNLNIDQFIEWVNTDKLPEKTFEFKINDDYTAIISKNKIVVGCQTIPKNIALSLAKEIIKVMND